ncbi:GntR family transcriptional regulator [Streptomyces xanthochromogenes]|uniref:GntR family transcriptional regulator n=1 Tax=Streptomyces xanthochromogenes TaxID=67384 RepID=UPI002F4265DF
MVTRPAPPLRYSIADDLRARIITGRLKPDERLPSEAQLAAQYRVSTPTLRNALAVLQGEGLIEKVHGKGNFVRRRLHQVTYVGGGHMAVDRNVSRSTLRVTVRMTKTRARGELASLMKVPLHSPLTEFLCVGYEGESPHSLMRVYVPRDLAPITLQAEAPCWGSVEAALAEVRPALADTSEKVHARLPTRSEAAVLRIGTTLAVLAITRVSTDITGRVAEVAHLVLPGDRTKALFTTQRMTTERPAQR